jgi:8-oxo-dGTP pyrophosphatase MutT (NUDIX family)
MSKQSPLGSVPHKDSVRPTDYLYRISIKCLIQNDTGEVLVVKETGRDWWDLPGGGMDHGESIKSAIAREMKEEVNLDGTFTYKLLDIDEPEYLEEHNFWQIRLIFEIVPDVMEFSSGLDADETAFKNPDIFKDSKIETEQRVYRYAGLASNHIYPSHSVSQSLRHRAAGHSQTL